MLRRRITKLGMFIMPDYAGLYQRVYPAELWFTEKKDREDFVKWMDAEGINAFTEFQKRTDGDKGENEDY